MEPTILDRVQLQDPADRGVRRIALALLRDADRASARLRKVSTNRGGKRAKADDALHDFRVALRRLRSWTRAFRSQLHGSLTRKQRRHLREIFQDTGVARDATVHLAWMRDQRKTLNSRERIGHDWLSRRLKTDQETGWIAALSAARRFDALSSKLARRLNEYCSVVDDEQFARVGVLIARRLLDENDALQSALEAIGNSRDDVPIHRARIAAKRLRYLGEQVAPSVKEGGTLVDALARLQDTLGDMHDTHVFSAMIAHDFGVDDGHEEGDAATERSRAAGTIALTQRLHERGQRAFRIVERDWLRERAAPFFARVRTLADEISRLATAD